MPILNLTPDELLSTTRAVRKRLDLDRPVEREVLEECLALAHQAPTGSNRQDWHFVVVTDPAKRAALGDCYRLGWQAYRNSGGGAGNRQTGDPARDKRRLKRIHGLLTRYPGADRFSLIVEDEGRRVRVDFPNHTTHYCAELASEEISQLALNPSLRMVRLLGRKLPPNNLPSDSQISSADILRVGPMPKFGPSGNGERHGAC